MRAILLILIVSCSAQLAEAKKYYYSSNYCSDCSSPAYQKQVYYPQQTITAAPGWRDRLVAIAERRDYYNEKAKAAALEQNYFLQGIQALGLQNTGAAGAYGYPQQNQSFQYGRQYNEATQNNGETVYGYTVKSIAEMYGQSDTNVLYDQAYRLAGRALELGEQARMNHASLVDSAAAHKSRVAEILAKAELVRAATPTGAVVTTTVSGHTASSGSTTTPQSMGAPNLDLQGMVNQRCASCHNESKAEGGIILTNYQALDLPTKRRVLEVTVDGNPFMPKNPDGSDGTPLNINELTLLFADLLQSGGAQ